MRVFALRSCLVAACLVGGSPLVGAADAPASLKPGQLLPGPFEVLAATGEFAGRFHCPVCAHGLSPMVLVFFRDTKGAEASLVPLLQGLDKAIDQHPELRLAAVGVLLNDVNYQELLESRIDDTGKIAELPLTRAILAKDEKMTELDNLAKSAKLKHVTLALGPSGGPKSYDLGKEADATVISYTRLKILGSWAFAKDQLTAAAAGQLATRIPAEIQAAAATPGG